MLPSSILFFILISYEYFQSYSHTVICLEQIFHIDTTPLVKSESEVAVMSDSLQPHGLQPTRLLSPWNFPGKSTGVDCHFFFQGIFPTQGLNPGLLHCGQTLHCLSHQGIQAWGCLISAQAFIYLFLPKTVLNQSFFF